MARFEPFVGTRYDPGRVELSDVLAPPYDVVGPEERAALAARSPWNVVRIDLSQPEDGHDRYTTACRLMAQWTSAGVLVDDPAPAFYVYRMGFRDETGRPRQTVGVIGALELSVPGEGDVLPHERTMSKPKDDRLNLMRACEANLSPVWGLSLAPGLSTLCELPGPPVARATDDEGVHHRLWRIDQPGVTATIAEAVASAPVVIADGHHRYETALAYRDEVGAGGDADLLMTYVVELADEQLRVRPIHRLLSGLPPGLDLLETVSPFFDPFDIDAPGADAMLEAMDDAGALGLVLPGSRWLLRPRPHALAGADDLDSARLARALEALPEAYVTYQHGADTVMALVDKGEAQAGVLLRPATVGQIAAAAHDRRRMPAKTTFFWPKPRTGLVFRRLARGRRSPDSRAS